MPFLSENVCRCNYTSNKIVHDPSDHTIVRDSRCSFGDLGSLLQECIGEVPGASDQDTSKSPICVRRIIAGAIH